LSSFEEEVSEIDNLIKKIKDVEDFYTEVGDSLLEELEENIVFLKREVKKKEIYTFLSEKYDKNNAVLEISAGAGGRDSEDFVAMLLRMYERYSERINFKTQVVSVSFGEPGGPDGRIGMKNVSLKIEGEYSFGFFRRESGTHRLVRKSPFSSAGLRHTSFAEVEVFPIIDNNSSQLQIKEEDLRIDTFRSSGPGGQHVNKRESAIRVTHLPTGIVVSSQSERLQGENKRMAMEILISKLERLEEEKKKEQLEKVTEKGEGKSWGNQIRNYVLHPYKLIKDLRTGKETSNVEDVLDGDLNLLKDDFFQ
jgi:peptide chain release factor 2